MHHYGAGPLPKILLAVWGGAQECTPSHSTITVGQTEPKQLFTQGHDRHTSQPLPTPFLCLDHHLSMGSSLRVSHLGSAGAVEPTLQTSLSLSCPTPLPSSAQGLAWNKPLRNTAWNLLLPKAPSLPRQSSPTPWPGGQGLCPPDPTPI